MSAADQLEQQYPGLLDATAHVESRGNPNAVSPKGARGMYQLMPATAAHYGVDPHDPAQAREAAAQNIQEGLKWSGGDLDKAMRYFQGGPNTKGWGKENAAYPGLVMAALQRNSGGQPAPQATPPADHDPYEQALSGSPSKSAPPHSVSSDPFEAALQGDKSGGNVNPPVHSAQEAGVDTGGLPSGNPGSPSPTQAGQASPAVVGAVQGQDPGAVGGTPSSPDLSRFSGYGIADNLKGKLETLSDATVGVGRGLGSMAGTAATLIGKGLDYTGLKPQLTLSDLVAGNPTTFAGNALKNSDDLQKLLSSAQFNPDGGGNTAGNIASSLPLAEMKLLQAAPEAGALVRGLKYAAQGGVVGGALSGGHDILANAGTGALLGPAGGFGGEVVGQVGSRLAKTPAAQRLIAALMKGPEAAPVTAADAEAAFQASMARGGPTLNRMPIAEQEATTPASVKSQVQAMMESGAAPADVAKFAADAGYPIHASNVADYEAYFAKTVKAGQKPKASPWIEPIDLAKGLKAAGARNGIEATTTLPAKVAEDAAALKASGVPDDHALNEASIRYVGGNPTVGSVTRERAAMQAEKEGAKISSEEGVALASRAAENNAALHDTVQETVNGYGGVPQEGTATQRAAQSLAKAEDAGTAKVSDAYATARATDGDKRVGIEPLTNLLSTPDYKFAVTGEGRQLVSGLRGQIKAMSEANGGQFSAAEIDKLTKAANRAYDPMGSGANHMIGEIKSALNESLDQFDNAGPAFQNARSLHRQVAEKYSDPSGIAKLIERDAKGNFTSEGGWRAAEGKLIGGAATDKAFGQVVRQLQANGDTQALDQLKAQIVQGAYQRSMGTTADELGNPVFSAKQWHAELNKIGMDSLGTLFSKDEIAHFATVGRAARALHESVPGTVNGSGTSAALINALRGMKTAKDINPVVGALARGAKLSGHILASHVPIIGNVAVEGLAGAAGKVSANRSSAATSKQLAKAIREALDPAAARKAVNDNAAKALTQAQRKTLAMALGKRASVAAASSKGNR